MTKRSAAALAMVLLIFDACTGIQRIEKLRVPAERVVRSYRLVAEGDRLLEEGKDHLALLKYLEAADTNPYHEVIFNKVAIVYSKLSQYGQARRAAQRAIGLNPKYPYAHNTLGIIELAEQDLKAAVRGFNRAIDLNPEVASFHVNLGHAQMQRHKFDDARKAYRKALSINPEVFLGKDAVELSFPERAKPDPERHYQMALFFAEAGDKPSCLTHLAKAFSEGFTDVKRLSHERAFRPLLQDQDLVRLLQSYGLT